MKYRVCLTSKTGKMGKVVYDFFKTVGKINKIENDKSKYEIIYIDFSHPDKIMNLLKKNENNKNISWIIGTTGFTEKQEKDIERLSKKLLIFKSGNMAYSVALVNHLLKIATPYLKDCDVEIKETHHRDKVDAPSGTAKMLAETIKKVNGGEIVNRVCGSGKSRSNKEIGISFSRGGSVVGVHTIDFLGEKDVVRIEHKAHDRAIFAESIYKHIIPFLRKKKKKGQVGLYNMEDLFSF